MQTSSRSTLFARSCLFLAGLIVFGGAARAGERQELRQLEAICRSVLTNN